MIPRRSSGSSLTDRAVEPTRSHSRDPEPCLCIALVSAFLIVVALYSAEMRPTKFTEIESGKRNDRPELEKALAACKKHEARLVIAKLNPAISQSSRR